MIQANELRIGNWFNQFGNYHQATAMTILELSKAPEGQLWCKSIHLTPKMLEKAGLVEDINGHYCKQLMTHEIELIRNGEDYYPIYIQFAELSSENEQRVSLNKIEYLHQLQNLYFALTQTELNIKL